MTRVEPDRAVMRAHRRSDGDNKARSHRGEHEAAVKTIRAGKAGMRRPNLWFLPRAFFPHGGHGCWPSTRPSLPPPVSGEKDIAELGRHAPRERGSMIIAGKHDTLRPIPSFNVHAGYFPDFFGNYSRSNIDLEPRYILLRLPSLCLKTTKRFLSCAVDYRLHISLFGFRRCDGALRGVHRAEHCAGDSFR